jgi:uncharacterized membrane protein
VASTAKLYETATSKKEEYTMIPLQQIHPLLVHFPIVLVTLLAGFDLVASLKQVSISGRTASGNVSTGLTILTALSAIAAYIFGGIALGIAEKSGFKSPIAESHETLASAFTALIAIWAIIRATMWFKDWRSAGAASAVFPVVAIAAAVIVIVTAYYGGQLVYDLGVNVTKITAN